MVRVFLDETANRMHSEAAEGRGGWALSSPAQPANTKTAAVVKTKGGCCLHWVLNTKWKAAVLETTHNKSYIYRE